MLVSFETTFPVGVLLEVLLRLPVGVLLGVLEVNEAPVNQEELYMIELYWIF